MGKKDRGSKKGAAQSRPDNIGTKLKAAQERPKKEEPARATLLRPTVHADRLQLQQALLRAQLLQSEASRQSPTAGLKAPPEIHPAALPPAMMTKPIAKPKYWLDLLMQAVLRTVKTSMKVNRNSTMST